MNPIEGVPSGKTLPGPIARGPNRKSAPFWEAVRMVISMLLTQWRAVRDQGTQKVSAPNIQANAILPMMVLVLIFCRLPVAQAMKATIKKPTSDIKR